MNKMCDRGVNFKNVQERETFKTLFKRYMC